MIVRLALLASLVAAPAAAQTGTASWYAMGHRTASGEHYNPDGMSCAHRTARFGTRIKVIDLATGRSITCRVNDRGPFNGRIIDLSRGAARALGIIGRGVARVQISYAATISRPRHRRHRY